jgi:Response regulator containing CheY-like receiver domain and AraC-type DNA-binding domain
MLRLIIVDDEKIIRETVHTIIDWEQLDIEVIGVCKNGIEAYDMILDHSPDIVLTDIKMPGLTGLELIERISNTANHIEFIILSGYGEFEYAKSAMQFGVKHYLLKPCNQEQIIDVMKTVRNDCYEKRALYAFQNETQTLSSELLDQIIKNLLFEYLTSRANLPDVIKEYEIFLDFSNTDYELYYIYYLEEKNVALFLDKLREYFLSVYPGLKFHAVYVSHTLSIFFQKVNTSYEDFENILKNIHLECQKTTIEYKRESYPNLSLLLDTLLKRLIRYEIIHLWDNNSHIPIYNHDALFQNMNYLIKNLIENNKTEHPSILNEIYTLLGSIHKIELAKALVPNVILKSSTLLNISQDSISLVDFFKEVESCQTITRIQELTLNKLREILAAPHCKTKKYKNFIEKAIQYINENLSDPTLSLKWIAENHLFMNVDYLSKQFVKQTGYKFSYYLTNARIEKAKLLLQGGDAEKIYLVAEQVGCGNNPQYFSQIFKKHTGITPTAYIKKIMEEDK